MKVFEAFDQIRAVGGFATRASWEKSYNHHFTYLSLPGAVELVQNSKLRIRGSKDVAVVYGGIKLSGDSTATIIRVTRDANGLWARAAGDLSLESMMADDWKVVESIDPEEPS